ncbi:MAG: sulfate adenylyltransferase subunit CysD, partial [Candidatus Nitrotoga sp.]
ELWDTYNTRVHNGENIRVFPISNWTEMDIWEYIGREKLHIPEIYYAHKRAVIRRGNSVIPVSHLVQPKPAEKVETLSVRFRTVGDMTCTAPVESTAQTVDEIIAETATTRITERGATRMDDQTSEASMELRKKEGYF